MKRDRRAPDILVGHSLGGTAVLAAAPKIPTAQAVVTIGVLFVIAQGDPAALLRVRFAIGDLWIVVASVAWVAYSVLQQVWPSPLGARERLTCITAGGLLVLAPFTLLETLLALVEGWVDEVGEFIKVELVM